MSTPDQFNERVRPDIVKRAVLSIQSKNRQPYGADDRAGLQHVTRIKQRNNAFRGQKGKGMSRTPKKVLLARGEQFYWVGAEAPEAVGGRRAHPPKPEKDFEEEINDTERRKAIRSAIAATAREDIVSEKHDYDGHLPIVTDEITDTEKTGELREKLEDLGLGDELERASGKKVRAGKGANRGRKYRTKTGPLLVTDGDEGIKQAASNIPGVDVSSVDQLNAEKLAPGAQPGRLVVWTEKSMERLEEEELYH